MEKMKYLILKVSEANGLILNPDEPSLLITRYSSLLLLFVKLGIVFLFFVISLSAKPYHRITVDGNLSEWGEDERIVEDSSDGEFTNRIDRVYLTWDEENLYIGISARVDGKGLLLYIDRDFGTSNGFDDLRNIDNWNKGAYFTNGFYPEFQYGSWDGESGNVYEIKTSTFSSTVSADKAVSFSSENPGFEIGIEKHILYPDGFVGGLELAIFVSLCDGNSLSTDSAPDTQTTLPQVDTFTVIAIDSNSDGIFDNLSYPEFKFLEFEVDKIFSPNGDSLNDEANIKITLSQAADVVLKIFTLEGRKVFENSFHIPDTQEFTTSWDGKKRGEFVNNGIYILHIEATNSGGEVISKNKGIVVVK
ncbi:MAG: gliding motility-associated C-terminal domain-containing protein [Elusimicrobia bacterium]|nr:gliding motility-associated C-terminal domain-containing protein [Elusimicrobiota bacterium]